MGISVRSVASIQPASAIAAEDPLMMKNLAKVLIESKYVMHLPNHSCSGKNN